MDTLTKSESRFKNLEALPLDGPFAIAAAFQADKDEHKVDLSIGVYRDDNGKPWRLPSVMEAKKDLGVETCYHEYLPLTGSAGFLGAAKTLVLGDHLTSKQQEAVRSIQTISGSGANSLIARFLGQHLKPHNIWLPNPTWANHGRIWHQNAPNIVQRHYPYYDGATHTFAFEEAMRTLRNGAVANDVLLLHACAHNPTGLDPSREQWREIAAFCQERRLFVVFDSAYQGFASGHLANDAWAVQHFFHQQPNLEMAVCQSFSKNMGLYGERVGALHVAVSRCSDTPSDASKAVLSQLIELQRGDISMPARFGATIAEQVMSQPHLREMWIRDMLTMSTRIQEMRKRLYEALVNLGTPGDWSHIIQQTGMFSYTGLNEDQVSKLQSQFHIYMLSTGRASMCGLTTKNVDYVAGSIHSVITGGTLSGS